MLRSRIHFELPVELEPGPGKHSLDDPLHELHRFLVHHFTVCCGTESAKETCVVMDGALEPLVARELRFSALMMMTKSPQSTWGVYGLVLPHEDLGDLGSNTAKGLVTRHQLCTTGVRPFLLRP